MPSGANEVPVRISARDTARAEPDQTVLQRVEVFFTRTNFPFSSNMWSMGPEPFPRSSMAASAPEM